MSESPVHIPQETISSAAPTPDAAPHLLNRRTLITAAAGAAAGLVTAAVIPGGNEAGAVPGQSQTAVKNEGGKCLVYVQEPFLARLQRSLKERSIQPLAEKFLIERDC